MSELFILPLMLPLTARKAIAEALLNPDHMVLPIVLGGILDQVIPHAVIWVIVCSAESYVMQMVLVLLAVRSLDLGFGVSSNTKGMVTPDIPDN